MKQEKIIRPDAGTAKAMIDVAMRIDTKLKEVLDSEDLQRRAAQEAALTPERIAELKRKAKTELPPKIAAYAAILGVRPTGFKVTSAAKRFGSCSAKNSLCFSWRLMQYPPEAIDYVVVHELCHILHHDHSPAFYAAVARVMPDYKRREKLLKTTPADD